MLHTQPAAGSVCEVCTHTYSSFKTMWIQFDIPFLASDLHTIRLNTHNRFSSLLVHICHHMCTTAYVSVHSVVYKMLYRTYVSFWLSYNLYVGWCRRLSVWIFACSFRIYEEPQIVKQSRIVFAVFLVWLVDEPATCIQIHYTMCTCSNNNVSATRMKAYLVRVCIVQSCSWLWISSALMSMNSSSFVIRCNKIEWM